MGLGGRAGRGTARRVKVVYLAIDYLFRKLVCCQLVGDGNKLIIQVLVFCFCCGIPIENCIVGLI